MNIETKLEILRSRLEGKTYEEITQIYGVSKKDVTGFLNSREIGLVSYRANRIIFPEIDRWIRTNCRTIGSFAELLGVTRQALSHWLCGRNDIPRRAVDKILQVTGLTYEKAFSQQKGEEETA